jgi:hypothetical protein
MKLISLAVLFLFSFTNTLLAEIQVVKKENTDSNTTLLVIGGIHGNEPGGYFAASILATHYTIHSKNLWIVPNLNKESILSNKRGIHGDMNRKFAKISKNDKDKQTVDDIKKIILSKNVSLVLNLHDGHGFYRKENKGSIFNPNAWGQTCVIDQCALKQTQEFGNLNNIALSVKNNINKKLLKKHHSFNVKNTKTKYDDEAMQLSLTYFAVTNNKPAFAVETSKNLSSLSQKVFYQLLAIEEFMKIMHIGFTKDFKLNEQEIAKLIENYGTIEINGNILLNFRDIKKSLSYLPLELKSNVFKISHILGNYKKTRGNYVIYIGNKKIVTLKPQYFKMAENCPDSFEFLIDGEKNLLGKTSEISVKDNFKVIKKNGYRVNIIGFHSQEHLDESNLFINLESLNKNFSVDKSNKVYRVEFYKNDGFCSMNMVHFR